LSTDLAVLGVATGTIPGTSFLNLPADSRVPLTFRPLPASTGHASRLGGRHRVRLRAIRCLALCLVEAKPTAMRSLRSPGPGLAHMLLDLTGQTTSVAIKVPARLAIGRKAVRQQVEQTVGQGLPLAPPRAARDTC
jgi:hypothetical protein